jgi:integrase
MATVFRKTVTRPLPEGAELFTRKGQRLARWRDRKGERQTGVVIEGRDGTLRVSVESATYVAKYRDGSGVVREVSTGCRNKDAALAVLAELTSRAENVRAGVVTESDDAVRDWLPTPIIKSVTDYIADLRKNGRSVSYIDGIQIRLDRIVRETGIATLRGVTATEIETWLDSFTESGASPRTRNSYLQAVGGFCRWCKSKKRLATDPLEAIAKLPESIDVRRKRRSMTGPDLLRLLFVARWRPLAEYGRGTIAKEATERKKKRDTWKRAPLTFNSMPAAIDRARERLVSNPDFVAKLEARGRNRELVYKTFLLTGLRRGELASLTVGSLSLETDLAYLTLEAGDAKNREKSDLPLRDDLADDLRLWLAEKRAEYLGAEGQGSNVLSITTCVAVELPHDLPLFDVPRQLVKTLDRDLAAAGIPKRDDRGRTLDVHALRHTFGSLLSAGKVAPRTAQSAMRHSSINLTMNLYTDPRVLDVSDSLDALPALPLDTAPNDRQQARATGTDDVWPVEQSDPSFVAPMVAPNTGNPCKLESSADNHDRTRSPSAHKKTPTKQPVSRGLLSDADGARTRNHWIDSPVL